MSTPAQAWPAHTMTADEFLAWAAAYEGEEKLELIDGRIVPKYTAMAPETLKHHNIKVAVFDALRLAVKKAALPCDVFIDALAVRSAVTLLSLIRMSHEAQRAGVAVRPPSIRQSLVGGGWV